MDVNYRVIPDNVIREQTILHRDIMASCCRICQFVLRDAEHEVRTSSKEVDKAHRWRIRGAADGGGGLGLDNVGNREGNSPADCRLRLFDALNKQLLISKVHTGALSIRVFRIYCATCVFLPEVWPPSVGFVRTWRTGWHSLISGNKVAAQTMERIHQQGNCL